MTPERLKEITSKGPESDECHVTAADHLTWGELRALCAIAQRAGETTTHINEILYRVCRLDDKPHQLFSRLRVLAEAFPSENETEQQEILKMCELGYENAHALLKAGETCEWVLDAAGRYAKTGCDIHVEVDGQPIGNRPCWCGRTVAVRDGRTT